MEKLIKITYTIEEKLLSLNESRFDFNVKIDDPCEEDKTSTYPVLDERIKLIKELMKKLQELQKSTT